MSGKRRAIITIAPTTGMAAVEELASSCDAQTPLIDLAQPYFHQSTDMGHTAHDAMTGTACATKV